MQTRRGRKEKGKGADGERGGARLEGRNIPLDGGGERGGVGFSGEGREWEKGEKDKGEKEKKERRKKKSEK